MEEADFWSGTQENAVEPIDRCVYYVVCACHWRERNKIRPRTDFDGQLLPADEAIDSTGLLYATIAAVPPIIFFCLLAARLVFCRSEVNGRAYYRYMCCVPAVNPLLVFQTAMVCFFLGCAWLVWTCLWTYAWVCV